MPPYRWYAWRDGLLRRVIRARKLYHREPRGHEARRDRKKEKSQLNCVYSALSASSAVSAPFFLLASLPGYRHSSGRPSFVSRRISRIACRSAADRWAKSLLVSLPVSTS